MADYDRKRPRSPDRGPPPSSWDPRSTSSRPEDRFDGRSDRRGGDDRFGGGDRDFRAADRRPDFRATADRRAEPRRPEDDRRAGEWRPDDRRAPDRRVDDRRAGDRRTDDRRPDDRGSDERVRVNADAFERILRDSAKLGRPPGRDDELRRLADRGGGTGRGSDAPARATEQPPRDTRDATSGRADGPRGPPGEAAPASSAAGVRRVEEEEAAVEEGEDEEEAPMESEDARVARLLEESRRRREAILAKHKAQSAAAADVAPSALPEVVDLSAAAAAVAAPPVPAPPLTSGPAPPAATGEAATSAEPSVAVPLPAAPAAPPAATRLSRPAQVLNMFADEDAEGGGGPSLLNPASLSGAVAAAAAAAPRGHEHAALLDNWDDAEGYYKLSVGEMLAERYRVIAARGRGVFSSVLYCRDLKAVEAAAAVDIDDESTVAAAAEGQVTTSAAPVVKGVTGVAVKQHAALRTGSLAYVAIKVIRNNDLMRRAGQKELEVLRAIATADPDGRYHCIRLLHTFDHRNHLCLVFEPMALNLKEVQDKFGKGVGLSLAAVRSYTKQILLALALLAKLRIIHADIKPHNVLANDRYSTVKLADYGSSFREDAADNEPTPYLNSRYYRAPEIILGYRHSTALDMWAVGCTVYELFTGVPLFEGAKNNDMLWLQQSLLGRLPNRMTRTHLRQAAALGIEAHFDAELRFLHAVRDPVTNARVVREVTFTGPTASLAERLNAKRAADDDPRMVAHLRDLLVRMLAFDPAQRISPKDALAHPFVRGATGPAAGPAPPPGAAK